MPFSAFARVALLSAVAAVGCNAEMLGKEWATVNRPQQVVCALDENGEVPSSWADYTRGKWQLPKNQGMAELFEGDYAFVVSEYYKACRTGRAAHSGGGFIGTLNQETEMIMCCTQSDTGAEDYIPTVMEGKGTFKEYGTFNDPKGTYYGTCSKAILAKGDYKICCDLHWSSGIFIKATNAESKAACKEPTTTTTITSTTATTTTTTATATSTTNTLVGALGSELTKTQLLLETQIQKTDKHVDELNAKIDAINAAHLEEIKALTASMAARLDGVKQQFDNDLAEIKSTMLSTKGVSVGNGFDSDLRQPKCEPFDESGVDTGLAEVCTPTIDADGRAMAMHACCGEIVLHSEQCSVNPCDTQYELKLLKDLLKDVLPGI